MLGLCGNYFSRYGFPLVGISRRDLLYASPKFKLVGNLIVKLMIIEAC